MKNMVRAAMALFFLVAGFFVAWETYHKPRLMILHSYDNSYVWTKEVNDGLSRVLENSQWLTLRYHYMQTKKFHAKTELRRAAIAAHRAIDNFKPDVLLAVDDYAQKLVASEYINNPKMKIVFAGVNGSISPYGYDKADNVTGILERKQFDAIKEMISIIHDKKDSLQPRVAYLSDTALSSQADIGEAIKFNWHPVSYTGGFAAANFTQWQNKVMELKGNIDFLLVSGYRKLPRSTEETTFVSPEEVMNWTTTNLPVPVLGLNVFNSRDGAMISVGVSPFEQGEVAANMAMALLGGKKKISDLPVIESRQYVVSMSKKSLDHYRITPPRVFEAFSRASNNYYE